MDKQLAVLFVCTGNTCRSSMAEALAIEKLHQWGRDRDLCIASAGTDAYAGSPATPQAVQVMKERGIDLSNHRARQVTGLMLQEADCILIMTSAQKRHLIFQFPEIAGKIFTLKEFAALPDSRGIDILDPFGGTAEVYRACAGELDEALERSLRKIIMLGRPGDGEDGKIKNQTTGKIKGEVQGMKIAVGSDHGGFQLKEVIKEYLREEHYTFEDFGTFSCESVDYPDYALKVAEAVAAGDFQRGILICGTGIGIGIAANKVPGIRAALCHDVFSAHASREHNDANILTMGERVIGRGLALEIVKTWLAAEFAGGRHACRVDKIHEVEKKYNK